MNVYIIYVRYERDEWYSVYHIETNRNRAIKHFKEVDLIDFLAYGPDDCHSFQLDKVVMSRKEYKHFSELVKTAQSHSNNSEALKKILIGIYHQTDFEVETLYWTDGCSDNSEIIKYYCQEHGLDYEDFDDVDIAQEALSDENVFRKLAKKYIKISY